MTLEQAQRIVLGMARDGRPTRTTAIQCEAMMIVGHYLDNLHRDTAGRILDAVKGADLLVIDGTNTRRHTIYDRTPNQDMVILELETHEETARFTVKALADAEINGDHFYANDVRGLDREVGVFKVSGVEI